MGSNRSQCSNIGFLKDRFSFIIVTVYTIRGINIPHVSLHYMFRPDGAIFMYIGVLQSPVSLSATLSTLTSVYTLRVCCMYGSYVLPCIAKCIAYWIYKY
jgi:hypothetical protein